MSILFESRLEGSKDEILGGFEKAKDKYEHESLTFLEMKYVLSKLEVGDYNFEGEPPTPIVGASLGALLDLGRREEGNGWYEKAKGALGNKGIRVIEEI